MEVREAVATDNRVLQELQARCPQGTSLIATVVNTPDFFARAKAYVQYKVYVASDGRDIIGSAACGIRGAVVGGNVHKVGYEFQYFTDPGHRGKGAARQLRETIEAWLVDQGAVLSYALIMEANVPSIHLFERQGFSRHGAVELSVLLVYKAMKLPASGRIRQLQPEDFARVADLLDRTWRNHDLYEPASADDVAHLLARMPEFDQHDAWVLEEGGQIVATLVAWDMSRITRVTVEALPPRFQLIRAALNVVRLVRPAPRIPAVGETWKQWCLPLIAFQEPKQLGLLLQHANNEALRRGADQILAVHERGDPLKLSMKGLANLTVGGHLYVKPLQSVSLGTRPVHIAGIDL